MLQYARITIHQTHIFERNVKKEVTKVPVFAIKSLESRIRYQVGHPADEQLLKETLDKRPVRGAKKAELVNPSSCNKAIAKRAFEKLILCNRETEIQCRNSCAIYHVRTYGITRCVLRDFWLDLRDSGGSWRPFRIIITLISSTCTQKHWRVLIFGLCYTLKITLHLLTPIMHIFTHDFLHETNVKF